MCENLQRHPLKLYIQDIFRAKKSNDNKYIYELFGLKFKNVMIHGVVTSVYNRSADKTNLEISDATGTIQVFYNTKIKNDLNDDTVEGLLKDFSKASRFGGEQAHTMSSMLDKILKTKEKILSLEEGNYMSVVGDIFVDDFRNVRMISAFECKVTSVERDVVWMEEIRYLYEKFYLWNKVSNDH